MIKFFGLFLFTIASFAVQCEEIITQVRGATVYSYISDQDPSFTIRIYEHDSGLVEIQWEYTDENGIRRRTPAHPLPGGGHKRSLNNIQNNSNTFDVTVANGILKVHSISDKNTIFIATINGEVLYTNNYYKNIRINLHRFNSKLLIINNTDGINTKNSKIIMGE